LRLYSSLLNQISNEEFLFNNKREPLLVKPLEIILFKAAREERDLYYHKLFP
jgi:hypothetical protein